jgi:hypothetical protein
MPDPAGMRFCFQKRMPAVTGMFDKPVAPGHDHGAMSKQAAQIANLFSESIRVPIGIAAVWVDERVPALDAHVFPASVTVGQLRVGVLSEEARQGVTDARQRSVAGEVAGATSTSMGSGVRDEDVIVNVMTPERAR